MAASPTIALYPPRAAQIRLVVLMTALSAMSYFNRTIMSIAGPGIMKEFGFTETQMGTVYSAFLLSYSIFMSPAGAVADRFGARRVLLVSGLLASLFTALTSLCSLLAAFIPVRLLFGVSTSPLYPSTGRISGDRITPSAQSTVQGILMAGAGLGAAISPLLFTWLIGRFGWRASFLIAASVAAVLSAAWYASVAGGPPRPRAAPAPAAWLKLLADRHLMMLTAGYFLLNYFEYIFFYWIYYYFLEVRKMGPETGALATTIMFVSMTLMTPLGGWLSDRLARSFGARAGRRWVSIVGMAVSAVLLVLGASGVGVAATIALLALAFGSCTMAEGPYWSTAINLGGKQAGAACGILNTGGNFGGMLAPVLTPLIAQRFGWAGGLYFASFLVIVGLVTWFWVDPERGEAGSAN